jgi:hypothetical protein
MTHYGLNPSFCGWTSRLPLFANPVRRGRMFEVFREDGTPTGEPSTLGADGWPVDDGRWNGVRVFGDMEGTMPDLEIASGYGGSVRMRQGEAYYLYWRGIERPRGLYPRSESTGWWHRPSVEALAYFRPRVLRTLDWSMVNRKTDWSASSVNSSDALQGGDRGMAATMQAHAARILQCSLWWNAPPRYDLPAEEYERRLEELLRSIDGMLSRPPILEYGNELWNSAFPVQRWLRDGYSISGYTWYDRAADEITMMKRVADRVFGEPDLLGQKNYYLFVGGQLAVPSHLDRILSALQVRGITPDLAGPALYVTPLKAHKEEWEATGAIPTQDELRSSCLARLEDIGENGGPLKRHDEIRQAYDVPYFACYEAGQSLIAGSHPWRRAAIDAQRTEWMGELYRGIRRTAEASGVDLLCWYSAATSQQPTDPRVDVFGLLESCDLSRTLPKARAARGD